MIVELFGAPGSGKTFVTEKFLIQTQLNHKFLTRHDLKNWLNSLKYSDRLFYLARNIHFAIALVALFLILRLGVRRPKVNITWVMRFVLTEIYLREFYKLNPKVVILLDQGSVQRVTSYIALSSDFNLIQTRFIVSIVLYLLKKSKSYIYLDEDIDVIAERIINRKKDQRISKFDALKSQGVLFEKIFLIKTLNEKITFPTMREHRNLHVLNCLKSSSMTDVFNYKMEQILSE